MAKLTPKQEARARKKGRKAKGLIDGIKPDVLERYMYTRVVCDRCGQEQRDPAAFPSEVTRGDSRLWPYEFDVDPCVTCGWDTGQSLQSWLDASGQLVNSV